MNSFKDDTLKKTDWLVAGILGAVSAVLYFASMATYVFPGESAQLTALWRGLDIAETSPYPLMAVFAKALGAGNVIAPICGAIAVMTLYMLVAFFVRERIRGEHTLPEQDMLSRIAAVVAAVVFMLTPAVREAASHLEPRLFDFTWALLAVALAIPYARSPKALSLVWPVLIGAMAGLGLCDSALVLAFAPFYVGIVTVISMKRGKRPYLPLLLFVAMAFFAFLLGVNMLGASMPDVLKAAATSFRSYYSVPGWLFVAVLATMPFVTALFSSFNAYNEKPGLIQTLFHVSMTVASVIAVATPLAPSAVMEKFGILPVASSAFAAVVAGHLVSYWWTRRRGALGMVFGGALVFVLAVTCTWNLVAFDRSGGAFADEIARRILADLGERKWFVSDGTIDSHLRIAAADAGKELNIVSLDRDLDQSYLERLGELVREKKVGGSKNESLSLSLSLGVLPFVQDWFAADPTVPEQVAIYGAPDLWYSAGFTPVPEFLFFGADKSRKCDWAAEWDSYDALLEAPKGWGSYTHRVTENPVERMRYSIRRHMGLVANDHGVRLQDMKRDDEAFAMYELVIEKIDRDNISALFNEIEMVRAKHPKALAKQRDLERRLKAIVEDKNRRYYLWRLGNFYGYIRNPGVFVNLGYTWARSGRPGDALSQLRRAIDFVPSDKRQALLNMMAALYANDSETLKSRKVYEAVLAKDAGNHDALIGLMRLALADGNSAAALGYLQKALENAKEGRQANIERAMLSMMKGDYGKARDILKAVTDANAKDLQAWSLSAAIAMQQYDAAKDAKEKETLRKELEDSILPTMEKQSTGPSDYYVQTTRAFMMLRKRGDNRREARDAFAAAARTRPDVPLAQDMVIGLDIALDDPEQAERHAREVLRRNRKAPLANYVMGSLARKRGRDAEAEAFLRRAADAEKPVVLAINDLAEVLRRGKRYAEAERYARKAVEVAPKLYVAWETLGSIIMDAKGSLDEAEKCISRACELSRKGKSRIPDVRMLVSLARVQALKGDKARAKVSIRQVRERVGELSEYERKEFEEFSKSVR